METKTPDINGIVKGLVARLQSAARGGGAGGDAFEGAPEWRKILEAADGAQTSARDEINDQYRERAAAMADVVAERHDRLTAYARRQRQVVPPVKGRFVVAGRVTDQSTGVGLPHVRVRASDLDRKHDDLLGEARTDALGYFRIEYDPADFKDKDVNPEAYIEVLDDQGEVVFTSPKSFIEKSGESVFIGAPVDGGRLPAHVKIGEKVDAGIRQREIELGTRERVLTKRPDAAVDAGSLLTRPQREARVDDLASLIESDPRKTPLSDVEGVGPVFRERLEKEGIRNAGAVASANTKRLAEVLSVSESRAKTIGDAARRTVESRAKRPG